MTGDDFRRAARKANDEGTQGEFLRRAVEIFQDVIDREKTTPDPPHLEKAGDLMFLSHVALTEMVAHGIISKEKYDEYADKSWEYEETQDPEMIRDIMGTQILYGVLIAAFRLGFDQGRWHQARIFTDGEET